jgi:hypothetical protein
MPEDDDWDPEAEEARFLADLEAGRARIPEEWEIECRPPVSISLGDAADVDPAELAAMLGPDGLGGEIFAQDRPAAALRPGPLLAALTERAIADPERLGGNELLGTVAAARRLAARGEHLELRAIAEFTRRQDARYAAAVEARVPPGRRGGGTASSPTRSWAWRSSPPPTRPATGWTSPPRCRPGCRPPARRWPPG